MLQIYETPPNNCPSIIIIYYFEDSACHRLVYSIDVGYPRNLESMWNEMKTLQKVDPVNNRIVELDIWESLVQGDVGE